MKPITMANRPHFAVTKAWDESGANFVSDRSVTVYSGTLGETCLASIDSLNLACRRRMKTTSTSLYVFANGYSHALITAVQVYIDNNLIYNDTSGGTYVDAAFNVKAGAHTVFVKARDGMGTPTRSRGT